MTPFFKQQFGLLIFSFISFGGWAQNLLPNPSFETFTTCPVGTNGGQPLECTPWINATSGTSDYFNACALPGTVSVPINYFGWQYAHTGNAYAGSYYKLANFVYREYIQAPLLEPLVAGQYYYFSMFVSVADNLCGVGRFGAYFSVTPPPNSGNLPIPVTPQFDYDLGYISDNQEWTLVDGCFYASGGEQYITIGNFHSDADTPIDPACDPPINTSYYYIDDVYLTASSPEPPLDIELGDLVTACLEYEIDPQIPDVFYTWEDGSHGTTFLVTESGTYSLTISSGCAK
jgi:OOP family OmpA-OmpF porin